MGVADPSVYNKDNTKTYMSSNEPPHNTLLSHIMIQQLSICKDTNCNSK